VFPLLISVALCVTFITHRATEVISEFHRDMQGSLKAIFQEQATLVSRSIFRIPFVSNSIIAGFPQELIFSQ